MDFVPCSIRTPPQHLLLQAARDAVAINPANLPNTRAAAGAGLVLEPEHLALLTGAYWGTRGVKLKVGFMARIPSTQMDRILSHMNAWGQYANVSFERGSASPEVRISFGKDGFWSYIGTGILQILQGQPTMNLQGFDGNQWPESEYHRVIRHETGHTLGFPHEHMRQQLVARLDPQKTIAYFGQTQGWSPQMVQQQVLTPLEEASIRGTPTADQDSIMCYQLPGSITTDGQPIRGGADIDPLDQQFAGSLYPLTATPPVNPPVNPPGPAGSGPTESQVQQAVAAAIQKVFSDP